MPARLLVFLTLVLLCLSTTSCVDAGPTQPSPDAQAGLELMRARGCTNCHSIDGTARVGPTFLGSFGRPREVLEAGGQRTIQVDAEYVARSLRAPEAQIAQGYPPKVMLSTPLDDGQLASIVSALEHLASAKVVDTQRAQEGSLLWLILGCVVFVGGHLGVSAVRATLIARLGEGAYAGLYSLLAAAGLGIMIYGWIDAPFVPLWVAGAWARWVPFVLMPFVMIGQWVSVNPNSPSAPPKPDTPSEPPPASGIHAITRHPGLLTIALWGLVHLPANGDLAALIFFGSLASLSMLGIAHIEHRRMQADAARWEKIKAQTSIVPFAAILSGRATLRLRECLVPIVGGLALYVGFLFAHVWVVGARPFPF